MDDVVDLILLRHGKAEAIPEDHRFRNLSVEGIAQARALRAKLGDPTFGLVISSELIRTKQTAEIVADCSSDEVIQLPNLFYEHDTDAASIDSIFTRIGHAPVSAWYADEYGDMFKRVAKKGMQDLIEEIYAHHNARTVLAVGHAILIPPMIDTFFPLSPDLLDQSLPECGGFKIKLSNKKIISAERLA